MPTYRETLIAAREKIAARIDEMAASPRPNHSIDGKSDSWGTLFDSLVRSLEQLDERIAAGDAWEEHTAAM